MKDKQVVLTGGTSGQNARIGAYCQTAVAAAADGGWSVIDVTAWAESGTHLAIVELARGPELAIGAAVATSANHAALLATARAAGVVGIHHRPSSSPWAAA